MVSIWSMYYIKYPKPPDFQFPYKIIDSTKLNIRPVPDE